MIEEFPHDSKIEILFLLNIILLVISKYLFSIFVIRSYRGSQTSRLTPNQYTLMIKLKRAEITTPSEIEKAVRDILNKKKKSTETEVNFLKINPIYDIKEFVSIARMLLATEKKLHIAESKGKSTEKLTQKKAELKSKLEEIKASMESNINSKFTGWVFVTFDYIKTAEYVCKANRDLFNTLLFWKKNYKFIRAPEPNDIIWENWSMRYSKRVLRRVIGSIAALFLIACNFGIILSIKWGQTKITLNEVPDRVALFFLSLAISLVISLVNILIRFILYRSTKYENYRTLSASYTIIAMKITLANFLNIVLIVLIANRVTGTLLNDWNIFGIGGTIGNIIIIMIVNVVSESLLLLFDPLYLLKHFRKKIIKQKIEGKSRSLLQCEANEAYEGSSVDLAEFYYTVFKTITIAFFYQVVIPYGLLLGSTELFFKYWVFKYIIVRRSKRSVDYLLDFSINMIKIFEFMIFLLALGFFVFKIIFAGWQIFSNPIMITILVIACYEILVGIKLFKPCYERIFNSKHPLRLRSFSENIANFIYDYDRMNPITQKIAYENYVKDLGKSSTQVKEQTPLLLEPTLFLDGLKDYAVMTNNNVLGEDRIYKAENPLRGPDDKALYQTESETLESLRPNVYEILNISNFYFGKQKNEVSNEIRKQFLNYNESQTLKPDDIMNEQRGISNSMVDDNLQDERQDYINFLTEAIMPAKKDQIPKNNHEVS